jgi:glycerol-1-phosphate dehydrogenase [NAD(P)+]
MHLIEEPRIEISAGASDQLVGYLLRHGRRSIRIVADSNTWRALGERLAASVRKTGIEVVQTVYEDPYLIADGKSLLRLLADDEDRQSLFVAVGSGTITDITRFVAHRTGRAFVSLPTAPSVDAYSSVVAPLVIDGVKRTMKACAPAAIFADTDVLSCAPQPMISAGFGDMICKFSAVADWRLGAMLWGESYDETIARRALAAAETCVAAADSIGRAEAAGVSVLMAALIESGFCMAEAGHSRPASGAEHQYSHFWEMRLLAERRPPILHGLKVGVGTLITAGLWENLRSLSRDEAARALALFKPPSREEECRTIEEAFGDEGAQIVAQQERFLSLSGEDRERLVARILDNWVRIQDIARGVPGVAETASLLKAAHCPTDPRELGLGEAEIAQALRSAHYLRDRFTVRKLSQMLVGM